MIKTLEWTDDGVRFIDQTKLPTEEVYVTCGDYEEVANAIRTMIVRGAPAIGVAAAMGVALGVRDSGADHVSELRRDFEQICDTIAETRPTAVNLSGLFFFFFFLRAPITPNFVATSRSATPLQKLAPPPSILLGHPADEGQV